MVDVFITCIVVMVSHVYIYVQSHQIVYTEYVQFLKYQWYLNEAIVFLILYANHKAFPSMLHSYFPHKAAS